MESRGEPERQRKLITTACLITVVVPMSANGTKRTFRAGRCMSAFGGKADTLRNGSANAFMSTRPSQSLILRPHKLPHRA
jgi:hypothetical protein